MPNQRSKARMHNFQIGSWSLFQTRLSKYQREKVVYNPL